MLRTIRAFWNDQRGVAMILVAIMIPVLIGFSLLAFDMSRATGLHQQLQKGIDGLALAAAAELDGRSDSITRADRAVTTLLANQTLYSELGAGHTLAVADVTIKYLTGIPASDETTLTSDGVDANGVNWASTDPKLVSLAEVTINASGLAKGAGAFATIFPASLVGSKDTMDIRAQAVAGFVQSICETVPIFMCNPFETTDPSTSKTIQQAFASGDTYGREFRILKVDSNPGPGNFGLLQNGLNSIQDGMAMGSAGTCYTRDSLTTKTGVTFGQVNTGLNVRFDLYQGSLKNKTDLGYRPASNVRKGAKNNCNKYDVAPPASALPLPPGTGYDATKGMTQPIADQGFWSSYWSVNHGGTYPGTAVKPLTNPTGDMSKPASRYDVYNYEIANDRVKDQSPNPTKERGTPSCYKGDLTKADPSRRLINMAVVDCNANLTALNGHTAVKPDGYASVFLIAPVQKEDSKDEDDPEGTGKEKAISLEIVDVDGGFANNTLVDKAFRNETQLYR
ncbi:pilus assembly protein TadG-related protein [Mesorhizobium australicum]|uniref:TadE/TadG family type IV pilus assembly protein n=1 Tax=Mesorhizobium australicum TaxID=536018 RepID=UPI00333B98C7